jgi:hypothetical protein
VRTHLLLLEVRAEDVQVCTLSPAHHSTYQDLHLDPAPQTVEVLEPDSTKTFRTRPLDPDVRRRTQTRTCGRMVHLDFKAFCLTVVRNCARKACHFHPDTRSHLRFTLTTRCTAAALNQSIDAVRIYTYGYL